MALRRKRMKLRISGLYIFFYDKNTLIDPILNYLVKRNPEFSIFSMKNYFLLFSFSLYICGLYAFFFIYFLILFAKESTSSGGERDVGRSN